MKPSFFLALLLITRAFAQADEAIVTSDQKFPSPSGRYSAQFVGGFDNNIQIHDNKKNIEFYTTVGTPLLSLRWTGDSKAMVAVEHMAGGSSARIIYLLEDEANRFQALPPDNGEFCKVIEQKIGWNTVNLTYRVASSRRGPYWTCAFDIDPATGKKSNAVTHIIDFDRFKELDSNL